MDETRLTIATAGVCVVSLERQACLVSREVKSDCSRRGCGQCYHRIGCAVPADGIQEDYYSDPPTQCESHDGPLRFGVGTK